MRIVKKCLIILQLVIFRVTANTNLPVIFEKFLTTGETEFSTSLDLLCQNYMDQNLVRWSRKAKATCTSSTAPEICSLEKSKRWPYKDEIICQPGRPICHCQWIKNNSIQTTVIPNLEPQDKNPNFCTKKYRKFGSCKFLSKGGPVESRTKPSPLQNKL